MNKDILTAGEVAKICRTSRQTVNRWLKYGELKGYRPTKKSDWRITRKELLKFMVENNIPLEFINEGKIKILVVDDEVNMVKTIERAFKNEEKFIIETAYSGFSAGIKLEKFKPEVIILDIILGDIDGREFFDYIRNHPEMNGTKIIGISGKLANDEIQPLLDKGFNEFLQKPFDMGELKKRILQLVEE